MVERTRVMVLDTETTGLSRTDQIIQFSAVDGEGSVLVNAFFRPRGIEAWPEAERVNGIPPALVAGKPFFSEVADKACTLLARMDCVIGWNLDFDLRLMRQSGVMPPKGPVYVDLMLPYSRMISTRLGWKGGQIRRQRLVSAAMRYRFDPGSAHMHDSLTDVRATLHVLNAFLDDPEATDACLGDELVRLFR